MSRAANFLARMTASLVTGFARFLTGVRPEWRGCRPTSAQRVYYANHTSHGDFVLIWTVLPVALRRTTRPVAARDYWDCGVVRGFVGRSVFNAVLIERIPDPSRLSPMEVLKSAIKDGSSLIFFPEGTRNTGDEPLLPFKSGLFHLAASNPAVEFVPVWIDNISRVMPKGQFLPVPLLCSVTFGSPLARKENEAKQDFLARARDALLELKPNGNQP